MNLASLVALFNEAKTLVVQEGPTELRKAADVLSKLEQASRQLADYIDGGSNANVQATAETAKCSEELQKCCDELKDNCSCDSQGRVKAFTPKATQAVGGLSPDLISLISALAINLIEKLLAKLNGGQNNPPQPAPAA